MPLTPGQPAPAFELTDTDGNVWSSSEDDARATVVIFTCNHCPYALAWHERIAQAARDYAPRGVRFLAINSNDAARYPRDSYEAMKQRVAAEDWPMPYLHDESQEVAHAYDAKTTPHLFVLDAERLDAVLDGREPPRAQTRPVGCSIKWRR
jgi:peroxiredoxin